MCPLPFTSITGFILYPHSDLHSLDGRLGGARILGSFTGGEKPEGGARIALQGANHTLPKA